jgi:4-methylaminobutanoate oxidase (formaldehyde-forming)
MAPFLDKAMHRVPATLNVGMKDFFCGPESFTPDLQPIVGEAPELRGYFVGAGMNSIGILTGGGMGRLLAQWAADGKPPSDVDITGFNIDRLHPYQRNQEYRAHRVVESLGRVYKCHYPFYDTASCRGVKRSPIHTALESKGAHFRDVSGWESADWYAADGSSDTAKKMVTAAHSSGALLIHHPPYQSTIPIHHSHTPNAILFHHGPYTVRCIP